MTTRTTASAKPELWGLLDAIAEQLPPTKSKLEALLNVSFERRIDRNKTTYFVCERVPPGSFGVTISTMSFHEPAGEHRGDLMMELTGADVGGDAIAARFPGGHWVPPPPPGWGGDDAGPAYLVDRPWGQLAFALAPGADATIRRVSFALGLRGSPGI